MKGNRRLGLGVGLLLGLVALGLVVAFAVGLPAATDDEVPTLPSSLPGGWVAVEVAKPPEGADIATSQKRATDYVRDVYGRVYDAPVAFEAYTDKTFEHFVVVTVFTAEGGAFGPASGVADPEVLGLKRSTTELVRRGDVVCVANYQPVASTDDDPEDNGSDASTPLGVSCQGPAGRRTVQVATSGQSVDATVALVGAVTRSVD